MNLTAHDSSRLLSYNQVASALQKKKKKTVQVTPLLNLNLCNALISCLLVS